MRDPGRKQEELRDDLKAYRLLTTEFKRLNEDTAYVYFLQEQIEKTVAPGKLERMATHIDFFSREYTTAVENNTVASFDADDALVKVARSNAGKFDIAGVFSALKRQLGTIPPYTAPDQLFESHADVSGIFTKQGYESFEEEIKDLGGIDKEAKWVLGYQDDQIQGMMRNQSEIADSLEKMYLREYADAWWGFLRNLTVVPASDIADAAYQMKMLSDVQNSLIRKIFDDVLWNTRFQKSKVEELSDKARKFVGVKPDVNPVTVQFKSLHQFVASDPEKGTQSRLDGLISQLAEVADQLTLLVNALPKDARKAAEEVLSGGGSLRQMAKQIDGALKDRDDRTRQTVGNIFKEPIRSSWKSLLSRAADYLNEEWRTQVVEPYKRLATGYPLDPSAATNVAPNELADLFADGGALSKFVEKELRPFLEGEDLGDARKWEGRGLELSTSARNALAQARSLKQSLFKGKDVSVKVNMTIEPPSPRKDVDVVCVEVGEKRECFDVEDGKKTLTFDWVGNGGASIRLVERGKFLVISTGEDEIDKLSFEGEWGLFRLISAGRRSSTTSEAKCKWTFKDNITLAATIRTDKGSLNPFGRSLSVNLPVTLF
jgi:type VI secretion system protein ImpL